MPVDEHSDDGSRRGSRIPSLLPCYFGGAGGVLLFAYSALVVACGAYAASPEGGILPAVSVASALMPLLVAFPFVVRIVRRIPAPAPCADRLVDTLPKRVAWFVLFFVVPFATLLVWQRGFAPMAMSPDVFDQYRQVVDPSVPYNDWHPVIHTLLALKLPLLATGSVDSIVVFQAAGFSAMLAWAAATLLRHGGIGWAVALELLVLLNPVVPSTLMYPWKDLWFGIACGFATTGCMKALLTNGEWVRRWSRALPMGIVLACACMLRHNGILFALPCAALLMWMGGRRHGSVVVCSALAIVAAMRLVLYPMLAVEAPDKRTTEIVGLPMSVVANVMKEDHGSLDEDTREFAYAVAPQAVWDEYVPTGYNSIKWNGETDGDAIEKQGVGGVLLAMARCLAASPDAAARGFLGVTRIVWDPNAAGWHKVRTFEEAVPDIGDYPELRHDGKSPGLGRSLASWLDAADESPLRFLASVGLGLLVTIALVCLRLFPIRSSLDRRKLLLGIAPLSYCFGTMLLLTGPDYRFFFAMHAVFPLVAFAVLAKPDAKGLPATRAQ